MHPFPSINFQTNVSIPLPITEVGQSPAPLAPSAQKGLGGSCSQFLQMCTVPPFESCCLENKNPGCLLCSRLCVRYSTWYIPIFQMMKRLREKKGLASPGGGAGLHARCLTPPQALLTLLCSSFLSGEMPSFERGFKAT